MKRNILKHLYRVFIIMTVLAMVAMAAPQSVFAASPSIKILTVKADDSVSVSAANFPTGVKVTAKMDVSSKDGSAGIVVGDTNSGTTGAFEATYKIPADLKGKGTITIRLEAPGGFFAYDWFTNTSSSSTTTTTTPPKKVNPFIKVIAVEKNNRITVKATGFPADISFDVKVGPYYDFRAKSKVVATIYTKKGGDFEFNVNLPDSVSGVDLVTIRAEGKNLFVYNAFKNEKLGTISNITNNTESPSTTTKNACEITLTNPSTSMTTKYDFDGAWTVKNTGTKEWFAADIDYKYIDGTKLQRNKDVSVYDLGTTVKPGESIKIIVDMVTPDTTGTYTTQWAIVSGSTVLCSLPLTITVK